MVHWRARMPAVRKDAGATGVLACDYTCVPAVPAVLR
jgi:hypothetical protein